MCCMPVNVQKETSTTPAIEKVQFESFFSDSVHDCIAAGQCFHFNVKFNNDITYSKSIKDSVCCVHSLFYISWGHRLDSERSHSEADDSPAFALRREHTRGFYMLLFHYESIRTDMSSCEISSVGVTAFPSNLCEVRNETHGDIEVKEMCVSRQASEEFECSFSGNTKQKISPMTEIIDIHFSSAI